jgi:hypothetical protein
VRGRIFLDRLVAPLASASLSQLYFEGWRVQSWLVAERSRSENPTEMSIHLMLAIVLSRSAASLASASLSQLD